MFHAVISCIENTFTTQIYRKMWNLCGICLFKNLYFICQHIYLFVIFVFNAWHSYVRRINVWMNKFCMIFIINFSHVKFVIHFSKLFQWPKNDLFLTRFSIWNVGPKIQNIHKTPIPIVGIHLRMFGLISLNFITCKNVLKS